MHPFPIKVKHRPKQNLSNMFLFDLFIYRGAFWGGIAHMSGMGLRAWC